MLPHKQIELRLQAAVREAVPDADTSGVLVRPCPDPKFGDYQSNALMSLAKPRKLNPRQLAEAVLKRLDISELCEEVEIAGAGFLNFRLKNSALALTLESASAGGPLFFEKAAHPGTVVVDFSSPNVAKPMHVGHIRSTFLGDSIARILRLLGHQVITDNHIGDWGTQFGKLIVGWKKYLNQDALKADPISEMERLYKLIDAACKSDPAVLEEARLELLKLQNGDAGNLQIWRDMIALSAKQFDEIYRRLGIEFDFTYGESFYNDRLRPLVDEFLQKNIARESEGAIAIFFDQHPQLDGKPVLVRKSDGASNYATTDLATLAFRLEKWRPNEIVYVTDDRQQLHFQQVFAAFRKWQPEARTILSHVWFGKILGENGKPFKTRSGQTVKLADLLDEAEERAFKIVSAKSPGLPEKQRREIARVVGIGAVKYADLLPNRQSDYVFSWDKMLALNGNTAPYLQYAFARIRSIFRKLDGPSILAGSFSPSLVAPEEILLAKHFLNFGLTLQAGVDEYRPNFLCLYLYDLAGKFTAFYENCPVLKTDNETRHSRLLLCDLTARLLKVGLEALGIGVIEQM
ncbi:MAG: arginine--tRNA ligase [Limisphaerales bacterium]